MLVTPWDLLPPSVPSAASSKPSLTAPPTATLSFIDSTFTSKAEYLDWLAGGGGGSGGGVGSHAQHVVDECASRLGARPELVLVADLSCSAALVQPLVDALSELRRMLPSSASAILCHEAREAAVDANLEEALAKAGLEVCRLKVPEEVTNPRLCMWNIPLGVAL